MDVREIRPASAVAPAHPPLKKQLRASLAYVWTTNAHAYAFSIAANALLSFFPFSLLLVTISHSYLRWQNAYLMTLQLLRANLPAGAEFIIRNLNAVMRARGQVQLVSALLLFVTASGVFLPLEVALNKIWGIRRDRSYLGNLVVSVMLAVGSGVMAFGAVSFAAVMQSLTPSAPKDVPLSSLAAALSRATLETVSIPLMIGIYFAVYYFLPNDRVPVGRVFPAAVVAALLTEAVRLIFSAILPWLHFAEVYGPFALSATLLIWSFLASLILLWGASFFAYGYELDGGPPAELQAARGRVLRLEL
jgi:membrane protein/epoxyqueuosine reductase